MRISIIPEDKKIIVDKKTVDLEDDAPWDFDDEHIHAIQWKDGRGSLEYEDVPGESPVPNKIFGEDEFETIVQPYLDYYNTFLNLYEQKELAAAIAEEENLAAQIEELNLDKLEKEAQLVIIEDLQRQNKELRQEKDVLADEKSRLEQAEFFDKQTAVIQLEREKAARESEYSALEQQKADEFFQKKSLELAKKYDSLLEDFEKEKEAFIEERKQYQELLAQEREKMERESELLEKQILEDEQEAMLKRAQEDKVRELENEQLELIRAELEMQRESLEIQTLENQEFINEFRDKLTDHASKLEMGQEFVEQELEEKRRYLLKTSEEIDRKMEEEQAYDEMDLALELEYERLEEEYREKQKQEILDSKLFDPEALQKETQEIFEQNIQRQKVESGVEYDVNDVLNLIDQIDPQQLYTTLTNDEREDNEFPVDKAVKWFAELKKVIDENQS